MDLYLGIIGQSIFFVLLLYNLFRGNWLDSEYPILDLFGVFVAGFNFAFFMGRRWWKGEPEKWVAIQAGLSILVAVALAILIFIKLRAYWQSKA